MQKLTVKQAKLVQSTLRCTQTKEFWYPILEDKQFKTFVQEKYQIGYGNILNDETRTDDSEELSVQ